MTDRRAAILVTTAVALFPLLFAGMYAGDAVIYLVYASNAAAGHLFEFNPGEVSAGVTSPGYMLLVALLFKTLPGWTVPLGVKLLDLLAWYSSLAFLYLLARRLVGEGPWPVVALAVGGLLPGSAYNANVGMENGVFAALLLGWLWLADRWRWWQSPDDLSSVREAAVGLLAGVVCWFRPEGFVVAPIALTLRIWSTTRDRSPALSVGTSARRSAGFLVAWSLVAVGLVVFHHAYTGQWLPSSAAARMIQGRGEGLHLGPLPLTARFVERLAMYLPLTVASVVGTWLVLTGRCRGRSRDTARAAVAISWLFVVLYSTVLGSTHLGRYAIFVMALLTLVAVVGARHLWQDTPPIVLRLAPRAIVFALAGLMLLGVFGVEAWLRRGLSNHDEVERTMRGVDDRHAFSEQTLDELDQPGERPVVLGFVEVQRRYWLDDRFIVRSLDGRVDDVLLNHIHDNHIDYAGYIKERHVGYLASLPGDIGTPAAWGLDRLADLQPGESAEHDGLRFTRLASGWVRVRPIGQAPSPFTPAP